MKTTRFCNLFVFLTITLNLFAYDFESGGLYYNVTSSKDNYTVEVTYQLPDYGNNYWEMNSAIIPSEVIYDGKNYRVTKIGDEAFINSEIRSISIPSSVTSIGDKAFHNTPWFNYQKNGLVYINNWLYCFKGRISENQSITISDGTVGIADNAFSDCYGITSISIPNSVINIGHYALGNCYDLFEINISKEHPVYSSEDGVLFNKIKTTLICFPKRKTGNYFIPSGVTCVSDSAFMGCSGLTSINIPNSVTSIGDNAFSSCKSLTTMNVPNSVTHIGGKAFSETTWFNNQPEGFVYINNVLYAYKKPKLPPISIEISKGTVSISGYAFYHYYMLFSVSIPSSVTSIGSYAFSETGLNTITIPNNVTSIGEGAFENSSSLVSVTIPNSVTNIGKKAFKNCSSLKSITIPSGVTGIGNETFRGCSELQSISIPDGINRIGHRAFEFCSELEAISIPNSVKSIGDYAFSYCKNLKSISIPSNVASIGDSGFYECTSLTSISVSSPIPPITSGTFDNVNRNIPLYVPAGKGGVYASAKYWNEFTNIRY